MSPLTTPPLAPKVILALAKCRILSVEDLQDVGACKAFLLLKQMGLSVTQSVFWQLLGVCENKSKDGFSALERQQWLQQLANMPPVAIFPPDSDMQAYMRLALEQAKQAMTIGEVPVGAVVVYQGEVIARAYNRCVVDNNVSYHAEIQALVGASQVLGNYRLGGCDLYVTLEPCSMCAGAIIQARVGRLIYATTEQKSGAAGSVVDLFAVKSINHHTAVLGGVLADEAKFLLQDFFRQHR